MRNHPSKRFLCLIVAAVMILGLFPTASAVPRGLSWEMTDSISAPDRSDRLIPDAESGSPSPKSTDLVRVSIILEDAPTLRQGVSTLGLAANPEAAARDLALEKAQKSLTKSISLQALDGAPLDVVWNLTLACNIISANVPYGKLDAIRSVKGVRDVVLEQQYATQAARPNSATSGTMIGASILRQSGLTGAGARIAVIDTGTDTDHQSFDNGAFLQALAQNAAEKGLDYGEYAASLELLDPAGISAVLPHLNAYERIGASAAEFYINEKLPFGANYVDRNLTVDHDRDYQGSHGSHVAGIAAANRLIPKDGGYADALQTVYMAGVAPDAQIITLKVFGNADGPYDSDYFAAIEDAIWLGCDSVNLSLGSGAPGGSVNPLFAELLDYLATTDTVVVMSAGNSGAWADHTAPGALYHDGVSFHTAGSPGTYTNSLAVASVENDGTVGRYLDVAGRTVSYTEGTGGRNTPLTSLDTSYDGSGTAYDYIYIDGVGLSSDYEGMDLFGKVVFCSRGEISFSEKAANAARLGAAAVVVCNNTSGILGMDLSDCRVDLPCVSILRGDGEAIKAASTGRTTDAAVPYYTGSLVISGKLGVSDYHSDYDTMSDFSSWGVPGSLELKPEITAPGGNIWSVNGMDPSGASYEMMSGTSMAAPQVSGMAALVSRYIRETGLDQKTGLSIRHLAQSLLMSTAQPMKEEASGGFYPVLRQGAGLARVDLAVSAESYVLVEGMADGKVKAELRDDARREGVYSFGFTIHDLSGETRTYDLGAELFTQALSDDGNGTMYLSAQTCSLPVRVRFYSGGASLESAEAGFSRDLNGDGTTNAMDADHLLEYLVGNADRLWADGDVDGDGDITSYDAHALLSRLQGGFRVDVPADGAVTVEVQLELPDETRALLDGEYPTGAYLEGFVFAAPVADSDGTAGVTHSIPILGYYGSWTDPGMFDVGSYGAYETGSESRIPYLYNSNGFQSNFVSISYGGREEYLFGGNPYVREDADLPRRNAFNNQNGWVLQNLYFSLIRNAATTMLLLEDADTGEQYLCQELGPMEGAYYHVNADSWQNTRQRLALGLDLSGFDEGTRLNLRLIAAPELYCTYDPATGTCITDWDSLADGAALTTSFTIDNTAPLIRNVELGADNVLRITAADNQYIAAAALLNPSGSGILTAAAANQTEPGTEMTIELDLSQVYGSEFLLAVYDYAENAAVCSIELELQNQRPQFTAIDCRDSGTYVGFDPEGAAVVLAQASDRALPRAAEYVEGAVFEITEDHQLHVAFDRDLYHFTSLGELDPTDQWQITDFLDLAYNRCDESLYTLFYSECNNKMVPYLATIDLYTGAMRVLGQMPIDANSLAIDPDGNFYSTVYAGSQLYRYSADVVTTQKATLIGQVSGYKTTQITSLAWDRNAGALYWAFPAGGTTSLLKLDPATAEHTLICSLDFPLRGLYIAYEPGQDLFAPTDDVHSVTMVPTAETLAGNELQLSARILPWNLRDPSLVWTSSDPGVAMVDENGLVRGLSAGTAVITAASALNHAVAASCTVTVKALDTELRGLVWDQEGQVWWSSFRTGTLPDYDRLHSSDLPLNAAMVADGILYASTLDLNTGTSALYRVDPNSFALTPVGSSSVAYFDLDYAPSLGYGMAVYFNYILLVDLQTGEYAGALDWSEGRTADLVGISYCGTVFNEYYGCNMDQFLILDADGKVYQESWIHAGGQIGYFNGPTDGYMATIGPAVDTPYFQGFHYDGSYAYWTRFCEEENVVELIAWECKGSGNAYTLGFFEEGVWPVGGLYTDSQLRGNLPQSYDRLSRAAIKFTDLTAAIPPKALSTPKGSLNAADQTPELESILLPLSVLPHAPEPTNGTVTVTFDPEALALAGVAGSTEAFAWRLTAADTIRIAFADRTALPAEALLAELRFRPLGTGQTVVNISFHQWNQGSLAAAAEIPVKLPQPQMPFADVPAGSFYYDPVLWAIANGITTGTSETTFDPTGDCMRSAVVTFLWRASGCPEPQTSHNPFTDVQPTDFFYKAVLWAVEMGITNGTSADTFSPYAKCNRAQVVTFLWRAIGQPTPSSLENPFRDVAPGQWYTEPVLWAVSCGITNGMGDGTFGVGSTCNRAQVVTFLYRTMAP